MKTRQKRELEPGEMAEMMEITYKTVKFITIQRLYNTCYPSSPVKKSSKCFEMFRSRKS